MFPPGGVCDSPEVLQRDLFKGAVIGLDCHAARRTRNQTLFILPPPPSSPFASNLGER